MSKVRALELENERLRIRLIKLEEKQNPQKVIPNKRIPGLCKCPVCKTELCNDDEDLHYCPTCGQALRV